MTHSPISDKETSSANQDKKLTIPERVDIINGRLNKLFGIELTPKQEQVVDTSYRTTPDEALKKVLKDDYDTYMTFQEGYLNLLREESVRLTEAVLQVTDEYGTDYVWSQRDKIRELLRTQGIKEGSHEAKEIDRLIELFRPKD